MSADLVFASPEEELAFFRRDYHRNKFLLHAIAASDSDMMLDVARAGEFEHVDVTDYLTVNNSRTSTAYGNGTSQKEIAPPGADITLSEFKRDHLIGTPSMPSVRSITYTRKTLEAFALKHVFKGDQQLADSTVNKIQNDLDVLRAGVAHTCSQRSNRTINECSELHPIFLRFTEAVLKNLGRSDAVASASFPITLNANILNGGQLLPWTVIGSSDLAVYNNENSKDVENSSLVCELKPPFKQLYRSLAYKQKDQVIGQTMGLVQMLPSRKVVKTILSDLFAINVCIYSNGVYYLSTRVIESSMFVLHFLLALSMSPPTSYSGLIAANIETVKVEPVYGEDEEIIESTPSTTQRYNLRSRSSSTGNYKAAGKRKRASRDFDSDEYLDERRTFEKWYADSHGLVFLQESALAGLAH